MNEDAARALATDRVIDITTLGRKSGEQRRIEIWYHRIGDGYFITGTPGTPRSWYANLVAHPNFTFHLKESGTADLAATARPVTEPTERADVLTQIVGTLGDVGTAPGRDLSTWIAESPLVEVTFVSTGQ